MQCILPINASHQSSSQEDFRVSAKSHPGSFLLHGVITTNGCKTAGDPGVVQATGNNVLKGTLITRHTQCFHTGRLCLGHRRWLVLVQASDTSFHSGS